MRTVSILTASILLAAVSFAADIQVVKSGAEKTPIDISRIENAAGEQGMEFLSTLRSDLGRSGWFVVSPGAAGALVVTGRCAQERGGRLRADLTVTGGATGQIFMRKSFSRDAGKARWLAHEATDEIVKAVKNVPGIATTRILLVGRTEGRQNLFLSDYDGGGVIQLTRDNSICVSPSWFPNGQSLLYTSFHQGYPDVYRIDLAQNRRSRIIGYPGLNAGASVSPDGRRLAVTLSKDGNPDIYIITISSGDIVRLTRTRHAAQASPTWSPDGRRIAFVSDSTGSPQLYVINASGGAPRRLTFQGSENVAPDWGRDGRIAYSSRRARRYQICVLDENLRGETQLTSDAADNEDPSWAPNSRHIAFTKTVAHRPSVYILDTGGDPPVRLTSIQGDLMSPAWSPAGVVGE